MHAEQNYTSVAACEAPRKRGFTEFCANNDTSKSGYMSDINIEDMMANVNQGMAYLHDLTDIEKVVILGHSGGGAMMAAYQDVAENGASACQGSEKIYPCSNAMDDLEPADGLMLLDANYGLSTMVFLNLNPAIMDENKASKLNQSLNVFNPNNGFNNTNRWKPSACQNFHHKFFENDHQYNIFFCPRDKCYSANFVIKPNLCWCRSHRS